MNEYITIVRRNGDYGIDSMLTGYYLPEMLVLKKRVYHGRIVYLHNKKQIGLPGLMQQNSIAEKHIIDLPF